MGIGDVKINKPKEEYKAPIMHDNLQDTQQAMITELQQKLTQTNARLAATQTGMGDDNQQQPDQAQLQDSKKGYFARKKEKKKQDEENERRYTAVKKIQFGSEVDVSFMQSDYAKNVLLQKDAVYKNEEGKEVTTTQKALLEKVMGNDFSHLEQLDPALRHILAAQFMKDNRALFTGNAQQDVINLERTMPGKLMNPLLRLGISLGMRQALGNEQLGVEYYKSLDALMNSKIMQNTLAPCKVAAGTDGISEEDIKRNATSQLFIAKTMFMCHMGKFTLKDHEDKGTWQGPVANAFAHCSRVGIVLPGMEKSEYTKEKEKAVVDSYTGQDGGLGAAFFVRGGATHTLMRKSKGKGLFKTRFREFKFFSPFHQRGMNVAVGGLGNTGITGENGVERTLKNDGSCGHIYMHLEKGDESNYTSMLVGFESDSYKKTNQLGHTHGFGNGEFASSFGGQRLDEIGDKYGGRNLDLTGIHAETYRKVMKKFEDNFTRIVNNALTDPAAEAKLRELNEKLCGERMSKEQLADFIRNYMPEGENLSDNDIDSLQ